MIKAEGVIGKVELKGPHGLALPYKVLQKYDNMARHWAVILLPEPHLFNSNFPGAASHVHHILNCPAIKSIGYAE
jgi:hypothetical protein